MQLFLFPYAGGSSRSFRGWPEALSGCCDAIPCDTPCTSRPYIDPPEPLTIQDMAMRQAMRLARHPGPFAIFGHSMGALVAFETACHLRRMRAPMPRLLILSAHRAPHLPSRRDALHMLPDADFDARLATYSGTPDEVLQDAEMMELFRPLLRRDFAACENYRLTSGPPLDIPALCLGGTEDPDIPPEDLSAWSQHFTRLPGLGLLPGGHFYFRDSFPAQVMHIKGALWGLNPDRAGRRNLPRQFGTGSHPINTGEHSRQRKEIRF
ncbi:thioesterase II family protein [Paracoccus alkanivorans]|nr:alpha/beta fold hydrolase [Paracoccus alkanivorans]